MQHPGTLLFEGTIEWEDPLKTKIQNHRFTKIAKTTFFFSIRACPRAAIANSRGLLLGLFSAKNDLNRSQLR
jgi:hypothetical protein